MAKIKSKIDYMYTLSFEIDWIKGLIKKHFVLVGNDSGDNYISFNNTISASDTLKELEDRIDFLKGFLNE